MVQAVLKGVDIYPLNLEGLAAVAEPMGAFDVAAAMSWFYSKAQGQKYDLLGLFNFYRRMQRVENMKRMWCSEFLTRWYRSGGFHPFNSECDADMISPAQFCQTSGMRFKWRSSKMPV